MAKRNAPPAPPVPSAPPPADAAIAPSVAARTIDVSGVTEDVAVPKIGGPMPVTLPAGPVTLSRDGIELVWMDGSGGRCGFVVETAHHPGAWSVEATLPPGTTRYAPVRRPPSNTDFYRVSYASGNGERPVPSNVVVIHFN